MTFYRFLADLVVVAPATAHCLGKLAAGLANDLLSTTLIAVTCPVLLCPSMNTNMFQNPIVAENISKLQSHGYHFMQPGSGELACKTIGTGRLPEPEEIVHRIEEVMSC